MDVVKSSLKNFLNYNFPVREKILDPWMSSQSINMIYSWRGVGKTYFALTLALHLATGKNVFGWKMEREHRVLYIDGEMPGSVMQERINSLMINFSEEEKNLCKLNFDIINNDLQNLEILDIGSKEGQNDLDNVIKTSEIIVIDNLSCLVRGGSEINADSWNEFNYWCLKKRSQGKSLIIIHHAGKSGAQRGTSKKEDILDVVISLQHPKNYNFKEGAKFEVHFEKARHLYGESVSPFQAHLLTNGVWNVEDVEGSLSDKVFDLYNKGIKQKDIAQKLNINKSTVSRYLKDKNKHIK